MIKYQPYDNAEYASVTDFLAAVQQPCRIPANAHLWAERMTDPSRDRASWYGAGCASGTAVLHVMREGWKEGRERLEALRSEIPTPDITPIDMRRRMTRGPAGDYLDMTSVWAGRLDIAWSKPRRQSIVGPRKIEIVANMICVGHASADTLFWRGAAAVILCDLLEAAGYMVRLVVCFGGNAYDLSKYASCRITVKEHGTPFDIATTSAVILPGFFRALGHAWLCNHASAKRETAAISVGCGKVYDGEKLISHDVRNQKTATDFINATLANINQELAAA